MIVNPVKTDHHLIQDGDSPAETTAVCSMGDFRFKHPDRRKRLAACYRHLADVMDPPEG